MKKITQSPVKTALLISAISIVPVVAVSFFWDSVSATIFPNTTAGLYNKEFWENLIVELHGILFELAVIGVLLVWLDSRRNRSTDISKLNEELTDIAALDFPEINVKKIGHIKRLNKMGVTTFSIIDLTLNGLNIRNIVVKNSKLIGLKLRSGGLSEAVFCDVQMRSSNFGESKIKNTKFERSNLLKSKFIGADCKGVSFRESSLERSDFTNCNLQSSYFNNSDIRGIKLTGANLNHCSFKEAKNIDITEIAKAISVDYIVLDEDKMDELKKLRPDMKYQKRSGRARRN